MKTKTLILVCLFIGIGLNHLSAQSTDRSYAWWAITTGYYPITCDGVNNDWLTFDVKLHVVMHFQNNNYKWEIDEANWEGTSSLTGEVFKGKELDKYMGTATGYTGTWRANIKGNMGDQYKITVAISWDGTTWSATVVEVTCR